MRITLRFFSSDAQLLVIGIGHADCLADVVDHLLIRSWIAGVDGFVASGLGFLPARVDIARGKGGRCAGIDILEVEPLVVTLHTKQW